MTTFSPRGSDWNVWKRSSFFLDLIDEILKRLENKTTELIKMF